MTTVDGGRWKDGISLVSRMVMGSHPRERKQAAATLDLKPDKSTKLPERSQGTRFFHRDQKRQDRLQPTFGHTSPCRFSPAQVTRRSGCSQRCSQASPNSSHFLAAQVGQPGQGAPKLWV